MVNLLIGDKIKLCVYSFMYFVVLCGRVGTFSFEKQLETLLGISLICMGGDTLVFIANYGILLSSNLEIR